MGGTVTVSIEVELGWGDHDTGELEQLSDHGRVERHFLSKLLSVTDRTGIPVSFDVVGHLFLEGCSGDHDGPHRDGWFDADPGTDYRTDGLFYAPDVVADIESSSVDHEICTHTFSHALFDEMTDDTVDWELDRAQALHREHVGRSIDSLVPPRHQEPSYDLLADHGIEVVRPSMQRHSRTKLHRFKELLAGPLPLSELAVSDGVVETYCTTNPSLTAAAIASGQRSGHPAFRYIPVSVRQRLHVRKLVNATKTAVEEGKHLHLWCHLFDLSNPRQFRVVATYFDWLSSYREANDLTTPTMNDLTDHVDASV